MPVRRVHFDRLLVDEMPPSRDKVQAGYAVVRRIGAVLQRQDVNR